MDRNELIKKYNDKVEMINKMISSLWTEPGTEQRIIELRDKQETYKIFVNELELLSYD
jgi:hypothetical protein